MAAEEECADAAVEGAIGTPPPGTAIAAVGQDDTRGKEEAGADAAEEATLSAAGTPPSSICCFLTAHNVRRYAPDR